MADFKVIRGESLIAHDGTTVTITEGVDYSLESGVDSGSAFCILTETRLTGVGQDSGAVNRGQDHWGVWISNPGNIATSLTFNRKTAESGQGNAVIQWEIIQYIGAGGGANEFIVRQHGVVTGSAAVNPLIGSTISPDPTTDGDVVIFITGQSSSDSTTAEVRRGQFTAALNTTNDQAEFTRVGASSLGDASFAVVEFTGSNWTIQRISHTQTAAGPETETVSTVVLAETFLHVQSQSVSANLDDQAGEVWLSGVSEMSFQATSGGGVNQTFVAWVIENTQASGDVMNVQHVADSSTSETAWTTTTSSGHGFSTSVIPSATSIMGACARCTGTGDAHPRGNIGILIDESGGADNASTTINYTMTDGGNTKNYRYDIVEWPAEAAGVTATTGAVKVPLASVGPSVLPGVATIGASPVAIPLSAVGAALSGSLSIGASPVTIPFAAVAAALDLSTSIGVAPVTIPLKLVGPAIQPGAVSIATGVVQVPLAAVGPALQTTLSILAGEVKIPFSAVGATPAFGGVTIATSPVAIPLGLPGSSVQPGAFVLTTGAVAIPFKVAGPSLGLQTSIGVDPVTIAFGLNAPAVVPGAITVAPGVVAIPFLLIDPAAITVIGAQTVATGVVAIALLAVAPGAAASIIDLTQQLSAPLDDGAGSITLDSAVTQAILDSVFRDVDVE